MSDSEEQTPIKTKAPKVRQLNQSSAVLSSKTATAKVQSGEQKQYKTVTKQPIDLSTPTIPPTVPAKPKSSDYRCFNIPDIKNVYIQLLNDNLQYLVDYIYANSDKEPYNSPSIRVALAMQMILSSDQLIPYQTSSMIAKDIEELRHNDEYTNQWANPSLKRKALGKELEMLKKHTEIDETMSLNLTDKPGEDEQKQSLKDFDIHSGVSTLNVSSRFPVNDTDNPQNASCIVM